MMEGWDDGFGAVYLRRDRNSVDCIILGFSRLCLKGVKDSRCIAWCCLLPWTVADLVSLYCTNRHRRNSTRYGEVYRTKRKTIQANRRSQLLNPASLI